MSSQATTEARPTTTRTKAFATRLDINAKNRSAIIDLLNQHLANLSDLFTQTKYAHWNVRGINFYGTHKLFDDLAEVIEKDIDTLAERIGSLGGVAMGTARMAATTSEIDEFPTNMFQTGEVIEALADRYASGGKAAREGIERATELEDADTADMLTDISRNIDHALYFLEAHLQK